MNSNLTLACNKLLIRFILFGFKLLMFLNQARSIFDRIIMSLVCPLAFRQYFNHAKPLLERLILHRWSFPAQLLTADHEPRSRHVPFNKI